MATSMSLVLFALSTSAALRKKSSACSRSPLRRAMLPIAARLSAWLGSVAMTSENRSAASFQAVLRLQDSMR